MFLCIIEYIYGITYFVLNKLPHEKLAGPLGEIKDNVFRDEIMFFTGIISLVGIATSLLGIFKKKRKKRIVVLILHLIFFYVYMNYFIKVPIRNIFTLVPKVAGYIKLLAR